MSDSSGAIGDGFRLLVEAIDKQTVALNLLSQRIGDLCEIQAELNQDLVNFIASDDGSQEDVGDGSLD